MSTTLNTPKKSRKAKGLSRKGVKRDPKFTALENAIVNDGISHGMTKALAIKQVRAWENAGLTPEQVAGVLQTGEGIDLGVKSVTGDAFDKADATMHANFVHTGKTAKTVSDLGDSQADGPTPEDLDALMALLGAGDAEGDDDNDRDDR